MAVEPVTSVDRQVVPFTWDTSVLDGEVVQFHCVNAETGGVSNSGLSKNDGNGIVSYPLGYAGITRVGLKRDASVPGKLRFKIRGRGLSLALPPAAVPPRAVLVIDTPFATTGQCGEATFPGPAPVPHCTSVGGGKTLVCR